MKGCDHVLNDRERQIARPLKPAEAAKILGSNAESVRIRMQNDSFKPSIGTACRHTGDRYTYEIFPERLAAYLGITLDEVFERLNAQNLKESEKGETEYVSC